MKLATIAAAAASLMLFATAAHAGDIQGPTTVIRVQTLDLDRASDRGVLLHRIEYAVHRACSIQPTIRERKACEAVKFEEAKATSERIREAVQMAQTEREGVQLFAAR